MSIAETIEVVTELAAQGAFERYAITGAVAALNYIEPALTEDLDILVAVSGFERRASGLLLLTPIENALAKMGYTERTDVGYLIEGWPVQFLPAASALDEEALDQAVEVAIERPDGPPFKARCLRAEHLVATAVKIGRIKDWARIEAFLTQGAVDLAALRDVLDRHGLTATWAQFALRTGIEDPLAIE